METKFKVTKGTTDQISRVHGEFKVSGTGFLCVWDENRGEYGSWHVVMPLTNMQIEQWNDFIASVSR